MLSLDASAVVMKALGSRSLTSFLSIAKCLRSMMMKSTSRGVPEYIPWPWRKVPRTPTCPMSTSRSSCGLSEMMKTDLWGILRLECVDDLAVDEDSDPRIEGDTPVLEDPQP